MVIPRSLLPYAMAFGLVALGGGVGQEYKPETPSQNLETQMLRSLPHAGAGYNGPTAESTPIRFEDIARTVHRIDVRGEYEPLLREIQDIQNLEQRVGTLRSEMDFSNTFKLASGISLGYNRLSTTFLSHSITQSEQEHF